LITVKITLYQHYETVAQALGAAQSFEVPAGWVPDISLTGLEGAKAFVPSPEPQEEQPAAAPASPSTETLAEVSPPVIDPADNPETGAVVPTDDDLRKLARPLLGKHRAAIQALLVGLKVQAISDVPGPARAGFAAQLEALGSAS
jgi:hypothetical protein